MADPLLPVLNATYPVGAGRYCRIVLKGSLLEQSTVNTFFYGAPTTSTLNLAVREALGIAFWDEVGPNWAALVSELWELSSLEVMDHFEDTGTPAVFSAADLDDTVGLRAGECLPPFAAFGLRRQVDQVGRHSRGGIRIAGVAETDQEQGTLVDGSFLLLQALGGSLSSTLSVEQPVATFTSWIPYLFTPWVGSVITDRRGKAIVDWFATNIVRTQNSRKYGVGA